IAVTGGVATNPRLRVRMAKETQKLGYKVYFPYPELCTDNAAMVALTGYHQIKAGIVIKEDADVYSRLSI
ncbi:MAG: tRNA (adenosine(37)-N6)-threonylcarbamoyltransferase complex transferase subunit TsaD, partial [Deltaproteobacteria bacterium]|nr:tRNA (adenosine(37)-N6)-threonylcarbamoyltransferase complex transferase subunit TsaD [Deltaproteobacteria bacterium]